MLHNRINFIQLIENNRSKYHFSNINNVETVYVITLGEESKNQNSKMSIMF